MITFKQFLAESSPSPHRMDGSFNVANVAFDNRDGLGSTPIGANIIYRGAVAWIKPSVFRKLALEADRKHDAERLEALMRGGKAIAAPWLDIDVIGEPEDPKAIKVTGHEGRARAEAFKAINGDIPMPVQLQLVGLRARNLSPEFFAWIEKHGLVAEKSETVVRPQAQMYYWNGQEIKT